MSRLHMPGGMGERIAAVTRSAGKAGQETGGFVLGDVSSSDGTVLALTASNGIDRRRGLFRVSGLALAGLFEWADGQHLTLLAQWHSHPFEAFLSDTDLECGLNVPGFQAAVVPFYEQPPSHPNGWGWWVYDGSRWTEAPAPKRIGGDFRVITFDEGGVREH
jgi:hypothetical protein